MTMVRGEVDEEKPRPIQLHHYQLGERDASLCQVAYIETAKRARFLGAKAHRQAANDYNAKRKYTLCAWNVEREMQDTERLTHARALAAEG
jgi:hypothetical protein